METGHSDPLDAGAHGTAGSAGVVGQAKEKTQQLVGQAKEQAGQRLGSGAAQLKGQASGALGHFAEAMRQVGQQYRQQNRGLVGTVAERAASEAQRLAHYLDHTEVDELVQQLERIARRQPAAFHAGAFAVGLAGARFLRSSRRQWSAQQTRGAHAYAAGLGAPDAARGPLADVDVTGRQPLAREGPSVPVTGSAPLGLDASGPGAGLASRGSTPDDRL